MNTFMVSCLALWSLALITYPIMMTLSNCIDVQTRFDEDAIELTRPKNVIKRLLTIPFKLKADSK
jgi:hypothetical protein